MLDRSRWSGRLLLDKNAQTTMSARWVINILWLIFSQKKKQLCQSTELLYSTVEELCTSSMQVYRMHIFLDIRIPTMWTLYFIWLVYMTCNILTAITKIITRVLLSTTFLVSLALKKDPPASCFSIFRIWQLLSYHGLLG